MVADDGVTREAVSGAAEEMDTHTDIFQRNFIRSGREDGF
jgi:hypothetical protein